VKFGVSDMKVMTPVLSKSQEGQQMVQQFETVVAERSGNDVVALDGDVILDLGGITYHDGEYHITNQPTPTGTVSNGSHQGSL
jgi:hypothetical protein